MDDILILGANGQVGLEIALLIRTLSSAPITCVVRHESAGVMLRAMGIRCVVCDLDSENFRRIAETAKVILECSWPSGRIAQQISTIGNRLHHCMSAIPRQSVYVNLSSMNAYGWSEGEHVLRRERWAKSPYAYVKRKAEKLVAHYCVQRGCKYVNLRLGQVHGALQSVSRLYEGVAYEAGPLSVLDATAPIVWTESIARYICAIWSDSMNLVSPGETIVAVDCTPWKHQDLYEFYANLTGRTAVYSLRGRSESKTILERILSVINRQGLSIALAASLADRVSYFEDLLYKGKRLIANVQCPSRDGTPLAQALIELDGTMFDHAETRFSTSKEDALNAFLSVRNQFSSLRDRLSMGLPDDGAKAE